MRKVAPSGNVPVSVVTPAKALTEIESSSRTRVRAKVLRLTMWAPSRELNLDFAIWTLCRPHDGVHRAVDPVGQLVNPGEDVMKGGGLSRGFWPTGGQQIGHHPFGRILRSVR